jgi:protein tyrosine phosphatase (PTP) superfamily phosphohydrolase (DUF442 family)
MLCCLRRGLLVLAAVVLFGNVAIFGLSAVAQMTVHTTKVEGVEGIKHLRVVDAKVWRGSNPSRESYRDLAEAGVVTQVDLRAGATSEDDAYIESLGIDVVHIPMTDGQLPSDADVDRFVEVVRESKGTVFVHCSAGVGRTGAMVAAYRDRIGEGGGLDSMLTNLAIGPPSLEQIVFAAGGGDEDPSPLIVGVSRLIDAPRQIFNRFG